MITVLWNLFQIDCDKCSCAVFAYRVEICYNRDNEGEGGESMSKPAIAVVVAVAEVALTVAKIVLKK